MKKIMLLGFAVLASQIIFAQSPQWKSGFFKELDNSYIETASGRARTIDEARNKAASEIIRKRDMATGASAKVVGGQVTVSGDVVVKSRVLDEFVERNNDGDYTVHLLTQTAKHPDNTFESVTVTDQYPFSPRSFVPGMEQIHKGLKTKGVMFIVGEVAFIGGIVAAESLRSSNVNLIPSTHNAQQRAKFTDNANMWQNVRNGCIAAAAALYVWNVIDAVTTKGARYVKVDGTTLAFTPYATPLSTGLALNINF